jgi:SAM-dependent methyltransferase
MPTLAEQDPFATPIFIQNFNQVTFLKKQIAWLQRAGYRRITVIDNDSTYPPLLSYYASMTASGAIGVVRRGRNDGKRALWNEHLRGLDRPFVFTSSDVVPDDCCPVDVVAHLAGHLRDNPQLLKAGLGLRLDNIPATYRHRREVLLWQRQYWRAPTARGLFLAPLDSTFALYRRGTEFAVQPAVRTSWPYLARHEPWYADSAHPSEEELNYAATIQPDRGNWGREHLRESMRASCETLAAAPGRTLVHLACGRDVFPGWINVDPRPDVGADLVFDLERCERERLPIADDSVDGFFMGHTFARIGETLAMLQELYRVAKPGARLVVRVNGPDSGCGRPERRHWLGRLAWHRRPAHVPPSFSRFGQPARAGMRDDYAADWLVRRIVLVVDPDLAGSESDADLVARARAERDLVREMIVELRAVKPPRPRHPRLKEDPAPTVSRSPIDQESAF